MSAEDLCDQWFAYAATNLNGAEPTIQALEAMERKEYAKYNKQIGSARKNINTPTSSNLNKSSGYPFAQNRCIQLIPLSF